MEVLSALAGLDEHDGIQTLAGGELRRGFGLRHDGLGPLDGHWIWGSTVSETNALRRVSSGFVQQSLIVVVNALLTEAEPQGIEDGRVVAA